LHLRQGVSRNRVRVIYSLLFII